MWFASVVPIEFSLGHPSLSSVHLSSLFVCFHLLTSVLFSQIIYSISSPIKSFFFNPHNIWSSQLIYTEEKEVIYLNQVSLPRNKLVYKLSGLFDYILNYLLAPSPKKWTERKTFHLLLLLLIDSRKLAGAKKSRANYENQFDLAMIFWHFVVKIKQ